MFRLTTSLVVLAAALATSGCQRESHAHEEPAKYLVTSPTRKDTELTKDFVAQIKAIQHIELRAMEKGYLQGIYVDEGQRVAKGKPMFQIMPLLLNAEVQKASAEADQAQIELSNTKLLADKNVVSPNELALAKARADKAGAVVSLAKTHKSLTEIHAPFDGIMGRFHVRLGSLVDEGELLTTLSDNSTMWVYFNVSEAEYIKYESDHEEDKKRPVKLFMANGQEFDQLGKIETIEADFNNENGNLAFRATFPNPKGLLRHGETGKVRMTVPIKNAMVIPQKATFDILDKKFVYVIDDKNVVHSREITVLAEQPHVFLVEKGLEEKDKILVEGLRKVRDGMTIESDFKKPAEVLEHLDVPAE